MEAALAAAPLVCVLLEEEKFVAAEPIASHACAVLSRERPGYCRTFNAKACWAVYLGRKDYSNAEPLLVSGCKGMKREVDISWFHARTQLNETLRWLYEVTGPPDKLEFWRRERADWANRVAQANASALKVKEP